MKNITIKQAVELMKSVNKSNDYESYFSGKGNGEVQLIVESKIVEVKIW